MTLNEAVKQYVSTIQTTVVAAIGSKLGYDKTERRRHRAAIFLAFLQELERSAGYLAEPGELEQSRDIVPSEITPWMSLAQCDSATRSLEKEMERAEALIRALNDDQDFIDERRKELMEKISPRAVSKEPASHALADIAITEQFRVRR